jgi:hypothetical protein
LSRDQGAYEVITMSLIDTWASTGAGAYSLSENGLYTDRGRGRSFLKPADADGDLHGVSLVQPGSPGETARMLGLAMETLWRRGAADPLAHLAVLQQGSGGDAAAVAEPAVGGGSGHDAARGGAAGV